MEQCQHVRTTSSLWALLARQRARFRVWLRYSLHPIGTNRRALRRWLSRNTVGRRGWWLVRSLLFV